MKDDKFSKRLKQLLKKINVNQAYCLLDEITEAENKGYTMGINEDSLLCELLERLEDERCFNY